MISTRANPPSITTQRLYWIATGLFTALFTGSVVFGLLDLNESYKEFQRLEFPAWSFIFLTVAKVLGLIAILSNRSQTLKDFAFAGFLYDLLLALGGHIAQREIQVLLPLLSLPIWAFAFIMNRRMYPVAS
jgi:hypothetical protein